MPDPRDAGPDPPLRRSSESAFWEERFTANDHLFGTTPDAFVQAQAAHLPASAHVVDLGGGGGRNAVFLARRGHFVTVADFSAAGLRRAGALARQAGVSLRLVETDLTDWHPAEHWDVVVATFVQLLPQERPRFYALVRRLLRPGGRFIGVFFRPEQITEGYTSGGPPVLDRMVTSEELRAHFPPEGVLHDEAVVEDLAVGPFLQGPAALVHFLYEQPDPAD